MSYQVIARKWRPQSFTDLVGQDPIAQTLLNSLKSNRLPHALLFTGPRGTGKTSTARILAKSLKCPVAQEKGDFTPCQACDVCTEIAQSRHIDVIEIDGASNNGVESIRELRETVGYLPSFGKYKVYIIDEVHMLSTSAFNALLKTLEEPPGHVVFILATTEVHKIPQTILSRCQRFDFRRITTKQIQEHLQKICIQDNIPAEPQSLWLIAKQGDGSMRDSQSLLEQVITFSQKNLTYDKVMEILGLTDRQLIYDTLEAILNRDVTNALTILERYHLTSLEPHLLAQDLMESIRHLTIVKVSGATTSRILDLPDSELSWLMTKASEHSTEDLHALFDMTLRGVEDIMRSNDPRLVLDMVILRLASAPKLESLLSLLANAGGNQSSSLTPSPSQVITAVTKPNNSPNQNRSNITESSSSSSPTFMSATNTSAPSLVPAASTPEGKWLSTIEFVKKSDILLGSKLEGLIFLGLKDKTLQLGIPFKLQFIKQQMQDATLVKKFKTFIEQFWGTEYSFEVQVVKDKTQTEIVPQQNGNSETESYLDNPVIKATQDIFKTQILSVKDITEPKGSQKKE